MLTEVEWGQCPVCARTVTPTRCDNIRLHDDKSGNRCPASWQPFRITEAVES